MLKPTSFHTPIAASEASAASGLVRKSMRDCPSAASTALTGPMRPCSKYCQTTAIATSVLVTGRKKAIS